MLGLFLLWLGILQGYFIGTRTVCVTLLYTPQEIYTLIHACVLCCGLEFSKVTTLVPEQCVSHCHDAFQEIYIIIHACVLCCGLAFFKVS